jgi:two-component system sensor histidine kinase KdpD
MLSLMADGRNNTADDADRPAREPGRPDPDALLARIKRAEGGGRGRHRIYLGAAPGVGKTYDMLNEGRRRRAAGTDVVVGFVETHGRPETAAQIGDLEVAPRKQIPYKGVTLEEMDTEAVIHRRPRVALVDELAHSNAPGSRHARRYQDVLDILDAGIDVISTVNIQHLESLNDMIQRMTGVRVRETLPDWVIDQADEVELVDLSPDALIRRMEEGRIYPPGRAQEALRNYFRKGNLTALRELALRRTAAGVDAQLEQYMQEHEIAGPWSPSERVMACVDYRPLGKTIVRRAWRLAAAVKTELLAVYVEPEGGPALTSAQAAQLEENLRLAEDLGAEVIRLRGRNVAEALVGYAETSNVAHLVLGESNKNRWQEMLRGSIVHEIIRRSHAVDVHVVAHRRD